MRCITATEKPTEGKVRREKISVSESNRTCADALYPGDRLPQVSDKEFVQKRPAKPTDAYGGWRVDIELRILCSTQSNN
jgi:hypothetical protein